MIRAVPLALLLALTAISTARAQTPPPCGGQFERYLAGYTVAREEIDHVFYLVNELVACTRDLERHDDEAHRLVAAMIQHRTRSKDRGAATFAALCASGNRVACVGSDAIDWEDSLSPPSPALVARLEALLGDDLPMVNTRLGEILTRRADAVDQIRGLALLRRASEQGDYWASYDLAMLAAKRGPEARAEVVDLLRKAAEQGHVPAMLQLAEDRIARHQDYAGAIDLFRRAAADPRRFRFDVAHAQYRLAMLLRDGERTQRDPAEAQRLLESAAKLGNYRARMELQKQ